MMELILKVGFLQKGPCDFETSIYCYTNGSSVPSMFVS